MDTTGGDALDAAFRTMRAGFEQLLKLTEDRALEPRDAVGAVSFMQEFERARNQLALIDHQVVRDAQRRGLANELDQPNLPRALAATLQISVGEAVRRIRAADAVAERVSMLGERLEPVRPHLAEAQRAGDVSPEQVDIIERALDKVSGPGFDPADVDWGEARLVAEARTFGPRELRRLAARIVDGINPDGTLPDDKLQADRRFLHLRQLRDGGWAGEFRLTGACGSKLQAILGPLAAPKLNRSVTEDGRMVEELDTRHHEQRMHDALEDVCDRLLRSENAVPDSGGTPATVILTFDLTDLLERTGYAVASDGTLIPTEKALQLASAADVYFTAVTAKGEVLNLSRQRRIASRSQTIALVARDGGCSFPGCDTAPEWCERHPVRFFPPTHPCHRLDQRWADRPGQPDPALSLPPPQLPRPGLELRDQRRRAAGVAATLARRPGTPAVGQHAHPRQRQRGPGQPAAVDRLQSVQRWPAGRGGAENEP